MHPLDTDFFLQNILQKIHIDIDGSKNDPKGFYLKLWSLGMEEELSLGGFQQCFF